MTASGRPGGSSPLGPVDSRALVIVGAAVVIGLLLLGQGFDDDSTVETSGGPATGESTDDGGDSGEATDAGASTDSEADSGVDSGTDSEADSGSDAGVDLGADSGTDTGVTLPPTGVTHLAAEITVLAVNSSAGESGIASAMSTKLSSFGYVGTTANGPDTSASVIYWTASFDQDALILANALGVDALKVAQLTVDPTTLVDADDATDAASANIIVVLGSDQAIRAA